MRYFIVALVVSLAWLHQDWFVWPLLAELNDQNNFLSWLVAEEHEVKFGIPANVGFQLFLSFATAGVALLAVWKAWPTELERWAEAGNGNRGNRGGRDRGRGRGRGDRHRGGRNRLRGDGEKNSGRSTERSTDRKSGQDDSSHPQPKERDDSSDRPRQRRRRGGRGRGGNGGGNSQSQPKAGE